ncbi:MAG: translation initiation factor eIF-2B [Candidatus Nezhaarchaeales archaeon]
MRHIEIVNEIKSDRSHGALWLALRSIDAFIALIERLWFSENFISSLRDLCERLVTCRPSMSSIRNATLMCFKIAEEAYVKGREAKEVIERLLRLKEYMSESKGKAAEKAAEELSWAKNFLTHSLSSTVLEFFRRLDPGKTVVVTESRPLLEGLITAKELASMGHKVKLITDASAYQSSKLFNVEVFVFGADTILSDGHVINKSGTAQISIAVKSLGVLNVVLCESFKVNDQLTPDRVHLEVKEPSEITSEEMKDVEVFNLYFDLTPPSLIDEVIMESGVFKPPFKLSPFTVELL